MKIAQRKIRLERHDGKRRKNARTAAKTSALRNRIILQKRNCAFFGVKIRCVRKKTLTNCSKMHII